MNVYSKKVDLKFYRYDLNQLFFYPPPHLYAKVVVIAITDCFYLNQR
jgi:hypothetical protein